MGGVSVGCDGGGPLGGAGGAGKFAGAKAWGLMCQAPSGALVKYLPGSIGALPKLIVCGPTTVQVTFWPTLVSISPGIISSISPCWKSWEAYPATLVTPGIGNLPAFAEV